MRALPLVVKVKRPYNSHMTAKPSTINSMQARAARAALRLSIIEVARLSGLGDKSVSAFEMEGGRQAQHATRLALQVAFERAGVIFNDDGGLSFSPAAVELASAQIAHEIAAKAKRKGKAGR
jgi:hypothetical protein